MKQKDNCDYKDGGIFRYDDMDKAVRQYLDEKVQLLASPENSSGPDCYDVDGRAIYATFEIEKQEATLFQKIHAYRPSLGMDEVEYIVHLAKTHHEK